MPTEDAKNADPTSQLPRRDSATNKNVNHQMDENLSRESDTPVEDSVETDKLSDSKSEYGGQAGPEPTRYGVWEKNGRCTDF